MPELPENTKDLTTISNTQQNPASSGRPLIDETVTAHLLQIFGNQGQQYVPTQAQVDKIIGLQEKGMDYTHKERTNFSPKQKIEVGVFAGVMVVLVGMFIFSVYKVPEYSGEIISGLIGLISGGIGGYGYGSKKKGKEE